jgi:hypothetical protein
MNAEVLRGGGGRAQQFKVGFLQRCADSGLTVEETTKLACMLADAADRLEQEEQSGGELEKQAGPFEVLRELIGVGRDAAKGLAYPTMVYAPLIGAPLIGGGLGYALGRADDYDERSIKRFKKRDLADFWQAQARLARASLATGRSE